LLVVPHAPNAYFAVNILDVVAYNSPALPAHISLDDIYASLYPPNIIALLVSPHPPKFCLAIFNEDVVNQAEPLYFSVIFNAVDAPLYPPIANASDVFPIPSKLSLTWLVAVVVA